MTPKFADIMSQPVRYTETEAWIYFEDKWQRVDMADVYHSARVLTEANYRAIYPQVPPLPITAFQEGGSRAATAP